jgi:hypothetical protein
MKEKSQKSNPENDAKPANFRKRSALRCEQEMLPFWLIFGRSHGSVPPGLDGKIAAYFPASGRVTDGRKGAHKRCVC